MGRLRFETDVRVEVTKQLGRSVPANLWAYVVKHNWINEIINEDATVRELVGHLHELLSLCAAKPEPKRRQRRREGASARRLAISDYLAAEAREIPEVVNFRSRVLGGKLLLRNEVEGWIRENNSRTAIHSYIIVRLPSGVAATFDTNGWTVKPSMPRSRELHVTGLAPNDFLGFEPATGDWAEYVSISYDGPLRPLYGVAKKLALRFGWSDVQATTFVLTDTVPVVSAIRCTLGVHAPYVSQTRISFTIDPTVTPNELSQAYKKYRAKLAPRVPRGFSEKHAELARFVLDHRELGTDDLECWNALYPSWKYLQIRRFRENARRAEANVQKMIRCTILNFRSLRSTFEKP